MDNIFCYTRSMKKEIMMKQSQAKKQDNAMTNKILMGLITLVLGLLFLEILIIHSKNEQQKSALN